MSASSASPGAQLRTLCRAHPHAPKVVLVPRTQIGRALEDALARDADGWAGVSTRIVRHHAEQVAQPWMLASGRSELPVGGRSFLAARLLEQLRRRGRLDGLPGPRQLADTVAEAIETLRRNGAPLADVQQRAETEDASATFRVVADCYEGYLDALDANDLYDDAQVFRWATGCVREEASPAVETSVVAVCDAVDLPEEAQKFLRAVRSEAEAFYRIGRPQSKAPPPQTAAARFADAPLPPGEKENETVQEVHVRRAVGSAKEVDALVRDLLDADVPFDEVEIAVAGEQPYVSLIADRAERVGLPVSIATGVSAGKTRTGTALLAFLEWVTEDFDPAVLIRMLRSGHLRIDRMRSEIENGTGAGLLEAHEVATLLAARRYEPGRDGYAKALGAAIGEIEERIAELEERGLDPERDREKRRALQFVARLVETLLNLVPREASVQEMAAKAQQFVERFGPVDPPAEDKPEAERTLDEAGRTVLWQRLDRLTRAPVDYEASGPQLAALLRRWLEGQYVRAEHPRPGTAHVVPLESAGYGDRPYLCVVGMDSDTLSTAAVEDAMLRDPDRRALSESLDGELPERRSASDEAQWHHEQALARHAGVLSLYTRVFDLDSGEERYPSPLFLRLEETPEVESERTEGIVPTGERTCLNDMEAWLTVSRNRGSAGTGASTARDALSDCYPWVRRGEEARQARQGGEYTVHDGLLEAGTYPELDFLRDRENAEPMSAGRLETFAETPYLYFLQYVLGVEPLDEPALDDEPWLNALRRGSILHATFEAFMTTLRERDVPPAPEHEPLLEDTLRAAFETEAEKVAPPSDVVEEAAFRRLREDALVFLRGETEHCRTHAPLYHEVGFGYGPYRRDEEDFGAVTIPVEGREMSLRGRIDRVDRRPDGTLAVWDYKTGRASSFEEGDPVADGAQLQWALYAYALATLTDETVGASGYYFPTTRERGTRLAFDPGRHRAEVGRLLDRLRALAASGSFPMHPRARYLNAWRYRGYDRLFRDLPARSTALQAKTYPEERPTPPSFG
nr:PD-(D/E)XK nuclease family protein [Salinibacter grassmerensis]